MFYALLVAALIYDFLNGFHDSSNIVATVISSRAMRPRSALLMTAAAEFIAPFLFGVAIAQTIGAGLIDPAAVSMEVILSAASAAIVWNLITWYIGIPSSSSHALIGGLLGSAILAQGLDVIQVAGLAKILIVLLISPLAGFIVGFIFLQISFILLGDASRGIIVAFKRLQILTSISLALSHGTSNSQMAMGIITLGLVTAGFQSDFIVPLWVIAASAAGLALGTMFGGWRLIHTLGARIYKIRPEHALTSQAASAVVILGTALFGAPVSTTQVVGSAIMGAGAAERLKKVRWQVGQEMIATWFSTIPVTAGISAFMYFLLRSIL